MSAPETRACAQCERNRARGFTEGYVLDVHRAHHEPLAEGGNHTSKRPSASEYLATTRQRAIEIVTPEGEGWGIYADLLDALIRAAREAERDHPPAPPAPAPDDARVAEAKLLASYREDTDREAARLATGENATVWSGQYVRQVRDLLARLAERDALYAELDADARRMSARIDEHDELEAKLCPEDVGIEEYVGTLHRTIAERDAALAALREDAARLLPALQIARDNLAYFTTAGLSYNEVVARLNDAIDAARRVGEVLGK